MSDLAFNNPGTGLLPSGSVIYKSGLSSMPAPVFDVPTKFVDSSVYPPPVSQTITREERRSIKKAKKEARKELKEAKRNRKAGNVVYIPHAHIPCENRPNLLAPDYYTAFFPVSNPHNIPTDRLMPAPFGNLVPEQPNAGLITSSRGSNMPGHPINTVIPPNWINASSSVQTVKPELLATPASAVGSLPFQQSFPSYRPFLS